MSYEVVSAWECSRTQPSLLLSNRGPTAESRTDGVLLPMPTPYTYSILSLLKRRCLCGCVYLLNAASLQVCSCHPFALAKVFLRPWQLPISTWDCVALVVSVSTEVEVFDQVSASFLLLTPMEYFAAGRCGSSHRQQISTLRNTFSCQDGQQDRDRKGVSFLPRTWWHALLHIWLFYVLSFRSLLKVKCEHASSCPGSAQRNCMPREGEGIFCR